MLPLFSFNLKNIRGSPTTMADTRRSAAPSDEKQEDDSRKTSQSPGDTEPTTLERNDTTLSGGLLLNEDEALAKARTERAFTVPIFVTFHEHDPENPRNFPKWKKWYITCFVSGLNVVSCLCAGGYSSAATQISEHFNVSAEIATLGLSMYILGFALGPVRSSLLWKSPLEHPLIAFGG